jgi:diacylglycerol kinase family enzyme
MNRRESYVPVAERLPKPSMQVIFNENSNIRTSRNPIRARAQREQVNNLTKFLEEKAVGLDVTFTATTSVQHARDVVREAMDTGIGAIGVIGGDGSNQLVATELREAHHNTHMVVLGGGTECILQQEMIKSRNPLTIAKAVLLDGSPEQYDLGMAETDEGDYYFLTNKSIGFGSHAMREWGDVGRLNRFQLYQIYEEQKDQFPAYDLEIVDKHEGIEIIYEYEAAFETVANNAGKYGGKFDLADSNMRDARLEGVVLPHELTDRTGTVVFNALLGRTIPGAHYMSIQDAMVTRLNGKDMSFQVDGETHMTGNQMRVTTDPKAITLWVPNKTKSYAFQQVA